MSSVALFLYGMLVTMLVTTGVGVLVWGAILDGRYNREQQEAAVSERPPVAVRVRSSHG